MNTRLFALIGLVLVMALTTGCDEGSGSGSSSTTNVYTSPTPTPTPTQPTPVPTYIPTPTPYPTYNPTPTPTTNPTYTPTPTPTVTPTPVPANPLTILAPTNVTLDSAQLNATIGSYDPYMSIVWSPSDTNPTYKHSGMVLGFQWGPYVPDHNVNWTTEFIAPFQLGSVHTNLTGRLSPGASYSYRIVLAVGEIRVRSDNSVFGNTPFTWYSQVMDFTTPTH